MAVAWSDRREYFAAVIAVEQGGDFVVSADAGTVCLLVMCVWIVGGGITLAKGRWGW